MDTNPALLDRSRDAGLGRAFEALCVIVVISGFLADSGGFGAIIGGRDFLFSLLKVVKSY
jgi:hypothetical protein